jgi:hypothetical protein
MVKTYAMIIKAFDSVLVKARCLALDKLGLLLYLLQTIEKWNWTWRRGRRRRRGRR